MWLKHVYVDYILLANVQWLFLLYFRYHIDSTEMTKNFVINVNISVCYETDSCEVNVRILNNFVVKKKNCNNRNGFLDKCKYEPGQLLSQKYFEAHLLISNTI